MRRKLLLGLFLVFAITSITQAQSVKAKAFRTFDINGLRELGFAFKAGEVDTSTTFQSNSIMTIFGIAYDGVAGDSAHFKLHLDVYGIAGWNSSVKTKTVTDDSTEFHWELTATFLAARENMRIRVEALGDCRVLSNIAVKLEYKGTEPTWYY